MTDFCDTTGVRSMELFCNYYLDGVGLQIESAAVCNWHEMLQKSLIKRWNERVCKTLISGTSK